jgi:predicted dehydrogenase
MKRPISSGVKIGVLGAGGVVKNLHLPALVNTPDIQVVWLCDKNGERARQLAKLFSIADTYTAIEECTDVDVVLVAIPVGSRHHVMPTIYSRGWHAFCEKPLARNLAELERYLEDARAAKVQLGIGLVRRFCPATALAKKIVQSGIFGRIEKVWASEGLRTKRTGQEADFYMFDPYAAGGGVLMETGSHLVDQLCTILNVVDFQMDHCIQRKFNGLEMETSFQGSISTDRQRNIRCIFEVSRLEDLCNGIFIEFSGGILKSGLGFDSPLEILTLDGSPLTQFQLATVTEKAAFALEWNDFLKQCRSGNHMKMSAESARMSMAIIEACYENAQEIGVAEGECKPVRRN